VQHPAVWRMLEQRINDLLAGISLADLTHDEPTVHTPGRWPGTSPAIPTVFFHLKPTSAVGFNLIGASVASRIPRCSFPPSGWRGTDRSRHPLIEVDVDTTAYDSGTSAGGRLELAVRS